ncbi:MAG: aldo/keto reductase [Gammaproteobacteria bacterium]
MKSIHFPDNREVHVLGQGTWFMGLDPRARTREADALRYGLDLGMTLIDTAEMYNDAELVVADALKGRRNEAFVVSKVLPSNASKSGTVLACEKSLSRLKIECLDLYLLHWTGSYPVEETLEAFERLVADGKIAGYGVSNLDTDQLQRAWNCPGGAHIATNQVLYNLRHRGIEWDLLPWCREHRIPIMAYSPLNQGRLDSDVLNQIAADHNVSRFQVALAWLLEQDSVIVIPKAVNKAHIDENHAALDILLSYEEIQQINAAFPAPECAVALEML